MSQKAGTTGQLRRYLLGGLPEEEKAEVERLYFASDELFEELLAEEDDLVDAFVAEELTADETKRFEGLIGGSARLRSRVAIARALRERRAARSRRPLAPLLLAALVILALGAVWAVRRPRSAVESAARSTDAPPAAGPAPESPATAPVERRPGAVVAYVLASGLTRDSSAAVAVSVPAGTESVELSLPLEADAFPAYGVLLRTGAGAEVLERAGLRSRREGTGPAVVVEVPAEKLPPGDYVLTLSGVPARGKPEVLAQFAFRVPAR